jgi:hypothetical protein
MEVFFSYGRKRRAGTSEAVRFDKGGFHGVEGALRRTAI